MQVQYTGIKYKPRSNVDCVVSFNYWTFSFDVDEVRKWYRRFINVHVLKILLFSKRYIQRLWTAAAVTYYVWIS